MRHLKLSLGGAIVTAAVLVTALSFSAAAGARGHCYINTKPRYPTLLSLCPRASIASGAKVVFTVRDLNASAYKFKPYLDLTKRAPRHGILPTDTSGNGLFDSLTPVRGHHGQFVDKPSQHDFPGYWNVTPGTYYIQIQQIEEGCTTPHCKVYSPVTSITVK